MKKFTVILLTMAIVIGTRALSEAEILKPQELESSEKFLGNIIKVGVPQSFDKYWNQVTPENSGKWASVEPEKDKPLNWNRLDIAYNHAKNSGYPFKQHTFVWGNQEPNWISSLSESEQATQVEQWIQSYCNRYPNTDYIDVVNEPLHAPPSYKFAIGDDGPTGWDWVVWAFQKSRHYCPNSKLLINEYGIINNPSVARKYVEIITILKDRGLIDGIGIQCHQFQMNDVSTNTMTESINILAATDLPVYISELDMGGDDATQKQRYRNKFPILWGHPGVKGITLWGYIEEAIWQEDAYLLRKDFTERPALTWIRENYIDSVVPKKGIGGGINLLLLE